MARSTKEWIGKTDDSSPPPRVRQRILDRCEGKCAECGLPIDPARGFEVDHRVALINGGHNRESNMGPVHVHCHKIKSAKDVKEKAKVQRTRGKHTGAIRPKQKIQSRGFEKKERKAREPLPPRQLFRSAD